MKQFVLSSVASAVFICASATANADYSVKAHQNGSVLNMVIVEKDSAQQACDLVVEKMEYFADLKMLDLRIAPVQFCPLDVVGARHADISWTLPYGLRSQAELNLRINGEISAKLSIDQQNVLVIEGGIR